MQIEQEIKSIGESIQMRLDALLDAHCDNGTLKDAMRYSLMVLPEHPTSPSMC